MPIYEYSCPKCGNRFEAIRPISKSEESCECPKCQATSKRTVSKFISKSKSDLSIYNNIPSSGGS